MLLPILAGLGWWYFREPPPPDYGPTYREYAYVTNGKTMGIPILYPWANRLGANTYTAEGTTVTVTPGRHGVRADPNGLPIHGVLAAYPRWRVTAQSADELTVELDFGADPELLASFPFPHLLAVTVRAMAWPNAAMDTVGSSGGVLNAGSFSTAGGGTTNAFDLSFISSAANNPMLYFQLLRSA